MEVGSGISLGSIVEAVQHGRTEEVISAVREDGSGLSAGAIDADGCSLMHWACINNRIDIVKHLIKCGAEVNVYGGILNESPLQWAARNEGYGYTHLIAFLMENGADTTHKSVMGHDALFLAVMAGNANVAFMLLSMGHADVNTIDKSGTNPLLWMYKKKKLSGAANVEMIRMLLSFGADATLADAAAEGGGEREEGVLITPRVGVLGGIITPREKGSPASTAEVGRSHGNNCLHYLALAARSPVDDCAMQQIVESAKPAALEATNSEGMTPLDVAKENGNSRMLTFLRQHAMYRSMPQSVVVWATAGLIMGTYLTLAYVPFLWTPALAIPAVLAYERWGMQSSIALRSSRVPHGFAWGVIITTYTGSVRYLQRDGGIYPGMAPAALRFVMVTLTVLEAAICYCLYMTSVTPPQRLAKRAAPDMIAALKAHSLYAPLSHEYGAHSPTSAAMSGGGGGGGDNSSDMGAAAAAVLRAIIEYGPRNGPESEGSVNRSVRERYECEGLPVPHRVKMCATCLLDRNVAPLPKGLIQPPNSTDTDTDTDIDTDRMLMKHAHDNAVAEGGDLTGPDFPIVYSTHCGQCDACITNLDHHCGFVDNCVGEGNRRMFVCFCFTAGLGCILAGGLMVFKTFFNNPVCRPLHRLADTLHIRSGDVEGGATFMTSAHYGLIECLYVTQCMLIKETETPLLAVMAVLVGVWIMAIFAQQVWMVATKTTTVLVMQADKEYWRGGTGGDVVRARDGSNTEYIETSAPGSGDMWTAMAGNLWSFLLTGRYEVVKRPVLKQVRQNGATSRASGGCCNGSSDHSHSHGHGHSHGGGGSGAPECGGGSFTVAGRSIRRAAGAVWSKISGSMTGGKSMRGDKKKSEDSV